MRMKSLLTLAAIGLIMTNLTSCKKTSSSTSGGVTNNTGINQGNNPWTPPTTPPGNPNPGNPNPGNPAPGNPNPGNPAPNPDPGGSGTFGTPIKGGYGNDSAAKEVPVTFVFVNSSTQKLTNNVQGDAQTALAKMNALFKSADGHQHIKFKIKNAIEVISDTYFNTSCSGTVLNNVGTTYGTSDSMVMLFVNDLASGCAGVSWLWTFPKDQYAVTMAEYRYPFGPSPAWTPVVHEFTHSFGFDHTGDEYSGSVPSTGLKNFKALVSGGGRSTYRTCPTDFKYFIDPLKRTTTRYVTTAGAVSNTDNGGILHNPYGNTMYPSFGGQVDTGFFGSPGYHYSFSWGFHCWYNLAKADI